MARKKILIFIDNDVMVRHFIANDTFKELEDNYEVIYIFNEDKLRFDLGNNDIVRSKIKKNKLRFTNIPRKRSGIWYLLHVINLFRRQRIAISKNGSKSHYHSIVQMEKNFIGSRNVFLAKLAGLPIIFHIVRILFILKLGIHKEIIDLIKAEDPSLLIHPSFLHGYFINDLFRASLKFKIPYVILANSWDNCCNNAFCAGMPNKLVVWGDQAKKHATKYIGVPEKNVVCFGAAQFEIYKKPPKESRNDLAKFFKVDPNKKILLYAGVGDSASETIYLKLLENAISNSIIPRCHVIYRPHPWRGKLISPEKDFLSLNWQHVSIDPTMEDFYREVMKNPIKQKMHLADYEISNKLLTLVNAVISPLSTMLIESLIKGKPVLAFFPEQSKTLGRLENLHFEEFIQLKEANTCFREKDFITKCKELLKQIEDESFSRKLQKSSEFFVHRSKSSYGYQLAALVNDMI